MDSPVPPELEGLFSETEFVALQTGATQNLTQEALQQFRENFKAVHELVQAQKNLLPLFKAIQKNVDLNKQELEYILEQNEGFDQQLLKQNSILEEVNQRLSTQENTLNAYTGIFDIFQKTTDTINATDDEVKAVKADLTKQALRINTQISELKKANTEALTVLTDKLNATDVQQKELANAIASLKKNHEELANTLLANNKAWEQSFANVENCTKTELAERLRISGEIKQISASQAETNNLTKETLEQLGRKLTRLEDQHTFLKWFGGSVILALMVWIWSHHNS